MLRECCGAFLATSGHVHHGKQHTNCKWCTYFHQSCLRWIGQSDRYKLLLWQGSLCMLRGMRAGIEGNLALARLRQGKIFSQPPRERALLRKELNKWVDFLFHSHFSPLVTEAMFSLRLLFEPSDFFSSLTSVNRSSMIVVVWCTGYYTKYDEFLAHLSVLDHWAIISADLWNLRCLFT